MSPTPNPNPEQQQPATPPVPLALKGTGARMKQFRLNNLVDLDAKISLEKQQHNRPAELASLHCQRAQQRLRFGFSQDALADMREVRRLKNAAKTSYIEDARFAEVLRVDARDRLLSTATAPQFRAAIEQSIQLFQTALHKYAQVHPQQANHKAWLLAHLGAAYTMKYWIAISQSPNDAADGRLDAADFDAAKTAFEHALQTSADYVWADRFLAFLYALRGKPADQAGGKSDFDNAVARLNKIVDSSPEQQSSLYRSLSMLLSYVAVQSKSPEAAKESVQAALEAMALDSEEFHAPHSLAASLWYLSKYGPEAERAHFEEQLQDAIESARIRTKNIISQASAVLASLALIEGMGGDEASAEKAALNAKKILETFKNTGIPLDLEASAMTVRSPAVAVLREWAQEPKGTDYRRSRYISETLKPIIHALRAKLA